MNKILAMFRYLLKGYRFLLVIAFLSIFGNLVFTALIFNRTDRFSQNAAEVTLTAPVDVTAGMFAMLTGMLLLLPTFKVALANGVSRKTFLLANLPAAALMAATLALLNLMLLQGIGLFQRIIMVTHLIYPQIGWPGLLLVQFAQYFLLQVTGWLIVLAYYRGSALVRWAISLAPFFLFGLFQVVNAETGGYIAGVLSAFWRQTMRSTPGMASFTMLVYTAILALLVYLLIRRAPLKS